MRAITTGRERAVEEIEDALYKTAKAGNVTAMMFFLRCRGGWSEAGRGKKPEEKEKMVKFLNEDKLVD